MYTYITTARGVTRRESGLEPKVSAIVVRCHSTSSAICSILFFSFYFFDKEVHSRMRNRLSRTASIDISGGHHGANVMADRHARAAAAAVSRSCDADREARDCGRVRRTEVKQNLCS